MGFRRNTDDPIELFPAAERNGTLRVFLERCGQHPGGETDFPALDIYETPGELVVEAELPGVDPARLEVIVGAGLLVIEGLKEETIDAGRVNFLCMERSFGAFRRIVPLAQAVNINTIRAAYRAGILQIRVPKVEEKRGQRRTIPVRTEDPATEE